MSVRETLAQDAAENLLLRDQLHIRLLRMSPGSDETIPHLEVSVFDWADVQGKYEALSYMWGSPDKVHQIRVGETMLPVRENLMRFILHYSKIAIPEKCEYIWIDALCINQEDLAEKARQVAAMSSIYRGARRVLVWLGEASEREILTQSLLDNVRQIYRNAEQEGELNIRNSDYSSLEYSIRCWAVDKALGSSWKANDGIKHQNYMRLRAYMKQICAHPYWSRLWIVQEIHLARNGLQVIAGNVLVDDEFLNILKQISLVYGREHPSESLAEASTKQGPFMKMVERARPSDGLSRVNGASESLVSNLHRYCLQSCSEPRDRIFGLLGLLDPKSLTAQIKVDYTMNLWLLFLKVLDLILAEGFSDRKIRKKPMLSWVRWLAWALEIIPTDVVALFYDASIDDRSPLESEWVSSHFQQFAREQGADLMTAKFALQAFKLCTINVAVSVPHTRIETQTGMELGSTDDGVTAGKTFSYVSSASFNSTYNYQFRLWLHGRAQWFWKYHAQTWLCQLDEQYHFPLAIQPQSNGSIRVLGYVAREQPGNRESPWKLKQLPPEITAHFQTWFDQNLIEIKQRWLQPVQMRSKGLYIPLSILYLMELAHLSHKSIPDTMYAQDLFTLPDSPKGIPIWMPMSRRSELLLSGWKTLSLVYKVPLY
jgi:hypothetical protein